MIGANITQSLDREIIALNHSAVTIFGKKNEHLVSRRNEATSIHFRLEQTVAPLLTCAPQESSNLFSRARKPEG